MVSGSGEWRERHDPAHESLWWRDRGYAVGAILIGAISDVMAFSYSFYFTAVAQFLSGALVTAWMYETAPARRTSEPRYANGLFQGSVAASPGSREPG